MKTHKLISLLLAVMILLSALTVTPSVGAVKRYKKNGIVYTLDKNGNATVVRLKFTFEQSINKPAIPSQIDGHTVTRLDFEENKNGKITFDIPEKLYIPKTVKYISKNFINYIWSYETYSVSKPCYRYVCDRGSYAQKFALKHKLVYIIKGEKKASGNIMFFLQNQFGSNLINKKGRKVEKDCLISLTYNGKNEFKPQFSIKVNDLKLKKNHDYKVLGYYNNFSIGIGLIKIKGIGDYSSVDYIKFKIIPQEADIHHLKTVSDNKVNCYCYEETMDGYSSVENHYSKEIQFSQDENFTNRKSIKCLDTNTLQSWYNDNKRYIYFSIDKLEKNQKYYFRVRNYVRVSDLYITSEEKVVIGNYKNMYGKWSKVKSITI